MSKMNKLNEKIAAVPSMIEDFSKDIFNKLNHNRSDENTLPSVNIKDTDASYCLEVAAPGMEKKDFDIQLDNGVLIIQANKENKAANEEVGYTRKEFHYQSFKRTFALPERNLKVEEIKATYEQGILYIDIPKTEDAKAKPIKNIEIN
jgi:HSP20 family protein